MAQQLSQDQIPSISMAQAVLVPFPVIPPDLPTSCAPNTNEEPSQNLNRHKLHVQQNILLQAAQALTTHAHTQSTLPHPLSSSHSSDAASENDTKLLIASLSARWVPLPSRPKPVYTSATGQAGAGPGASREWTSAAARVMLEAAGRLEEVEREREREMGKERGAGGGGGGGRGGAWGAGGGSGAYDASRDPRLRR